MDKNPLINEYKSYWNLQTLMKISEFSDVTATNWPYDEALNIESHFCTYCSSFWGSKIIFLKLNLPYQTIKSDLAWTYLAAIFMYRNIKYISLKLGVFYLLTWLDYQEKIWSVLHRAHLTLVNIR